MPPLRWLASVVLASCFAAPLSEAASLSTDASSGRRLRHQPSAQLQVSNATAGAAGSFVRSLAFRHTLRVCNAYPSADVVDVYQADTKVTESSLAYKACEEFQKVQLHTGDRLLFKFGEGVEGSFVVAELPSNDAVLMLVVYRHDPSSTAVAFESHVFANLVNAQIAVLDTYKGTAMSKAWIRDTAGQKTARNEELRYDSVVAVNPGMYEVVLTSAEGEQTASQQLVAVNRESYVVVRCGVESQQGQSYPQDLMVFPRSDPKVLEGAAASKNAVVAMSLALFSVVAAIWA